MMCVAELHTIWSMPIQNVGPLYPIIHVVIEMLQPHIKRYSMVQ